MTSLKPSILFVDDEPAIRRVLERAFEKAGFAVASVPTGEDALVHLKKAPSDVVLLDLNMPGISGQDVCRQIRADPALESVAVLIVTGRVADGLPASLLDAGADDYVGKPFDIKELVARVRAILRRPRVFVGDHSVIRKGDLAIDGASRQVFVSDQPVKMTPKEFELLKILVIHSPKVIDRDTLMREVWGADNSLVNDRSLDVHIRRIRQKIGSLDAFLRTVQTIGYQWVDGTLADKANAPPH